MTAVLLTVAMAVWARSPISFTLENDGHKMKFSATGINITKKGKPKKKDNLTSPGHELKLDMGAQSPLAPPSRLRSRRFPEKGFQG